jgi:Ribosomal protein L1p/L10e family
MHPRLRIPTTLRPTSSFCATKTVHLFCRTYAARPPKKSKKEKKKQRSEFIQYDLKDADQFTLVEAVRYIRAMEVGQNPTSVKYDLAVKLRTPKTSPVVRNRIRLPTPVKTDKRVCVIAEGEHAEAAKKAGAAIVGTEEVFEQVCILHLYMHCPSSVHPHIHYPSSVYLEMHCPYIVHL